MFFPYDVTNEIVAHFIGYFELSVEDMRVRLDYQEFAYLHPEEDIPEYLTPLTPELAQRYSLQDFDPNAGYVPPDWAIQGASHVPATVPDLPIIAPAPLAAAREPVDHHDKLGAGKLQNQSAPEGDAPLSTVALINQTIVLDDNDVVTIGDFSGNVVFVSGSGEAILGFQTQADAISGALIGSPDFSDYAGIADFIIATAARADQIADAPELDGASVITAPSGTYVNGVAAAEAPELLELLPAKLAAVLGGEPVAAEAEDEIGTDEATQSQTIAFDEMTPSMTLNAGGNMLVNEITVVNAGLQASVMAVQGNFHQLDVIIQINAFSDSDTIIGATGEGHVPGPETVAYNIASFETKTSDVLAKAAEANPGTMPLSWTVTVVSGDLVFVEWMKQFTFQSDQDVHVLSAIGANTVVTTGENIGLNAISFADLGRYFDLVIVGGNLYDANIIVQTNILYDNDTIQYLGGQQSDADNLATQGNLLSNEASILNVGPTEFGTPMPGHVSDAMANLSTGNQHMPSGFDSDGIFEGLSALRVLYVAGDIYDLRYLQQTNVLGDADLVALQQAQLFVDNPGTDWAISTGANALANQARIVDYDGVGDSVYVGGEHYSDAILIQANILASDNAGSSGDALVSEVIAFLDNDVPDMPGDDGPFSSSTVSSDGPPADIMQTVLA